MTLKTSVPKAAVANFNQSRRDAAGDGVYVYTPSTPGFAARVTNVHENSLCLSVTAIVGADDRGAHRFAPRLRAIFPPANPLQKNAKETKNDDIGTKDSRMATGTKTRSKGRKITQPRMAGIDERQQADACSPRQGLPPNRGHFRQRVTGKT
ncbi:hypothetical protein Ga0100231_006270 [Opitutaceae bacterium TAV4]|nr:hypothetical protein Ga0100231_006270 [Opitutaceae bacterium TAV4]